MERIEQQYVTVNVWVLGRREALEKDHVAVLIELIRVCCPWVTLTVQH